MKKGIWKSDWLVGLLITLVFLAFSGSNFLQGLERSAYDFSVRSSNRIPSDRIAVIAIDDESIANIGRWPWPRDVHAQMHEILTEAGARVIGQTVFFIEPQIDPGLEFISELKTAFKSSSIASIPGRIADLEKIVKDARKLVKGQRDANGRAAINRVSDYLASSPLKTSVAGEIGDYMAFLESAEIALNTDLKLAESIAKTNNVVLAMPFIPGTQLGVPDEQLPEYVQQNKLTEANIIDNTRTNPGRHTPIKMADAYAPIVAAGEAAAAIGALVSIPDVDGGIRTEPLLVHFYGNYYPSMALLLAAKSLNLDVNDITAIFGNSVSLGSLNIRTDAESLINTFFYSDNGAGKPAFPVDSFYDVLQGKIPASKYQDKVVLIGATAIGVGDSMVTPINPTMAPVLTLAHSVSSILNEDFFIQPSWGRYATLGAFALVAFHLMIVLPRLGAGIGFSVSALLFVALFATEYTMMTTQGTWIKLMLPGMLLVVGHLLLTTKRFLVTERGKARLDLESAESNRMLGLSLQGQGQLDMAFEKFRKLPADKSSLELLYNLALDYERKRQFNKARSVYDYIKEFDAAFRDIDDRSNRASAMDQTMILGGGNTTAGGTLILDRSGVEKPKLGRYEIERELGKGAMGAVYLGKDPKISRVVAIKTMALSEEFAADELQDVKDRFFREAETAGRLTHPSIVTIYDAGEEHDLAYIAMEFLKGADLNRYTKKDSLLPIDKVLNLVKRAAEGLGYAHSQNVVHRDIKPANIMWDPATDNMKITDFGIARITDSSKTKTGLVMGTPSYMSPEQLSGKKIGGQSDLFSLGIMLYQMVTGELPFKGDSMTNVMYKIANEKQASADSVNPDVPRCVGVVINRAMEKDTAKRYKTGEQMAADISKCQKIIVAERKGLRKPMSLKDKIEIFGLTDVGLVRHHNEDSIGNNHDLGILVLADGMGGHRGGEVASAITVSTVLEALVDNLKAIGPGDSDEYNGYSLQGIAVHDAIESANEKVLAASKENSHYRGMGTTVVVLLFHNNRFIVAHVGDSRLYRYRDGELEQITNDHSLMQELIDKGFYSPEQAEQSLNRNLVTRAIGIEKSVEIDVLEDDVSIGDIFLLCSDGVTDMVGDDAIKNVIMNNGEDLQDTATELVRLSNEAGGKDNISVILARPLKPFPRDDDLFSRFFGLFS